MATWREGRREWGDRGSKREQESKRQEREERTSSPFYSGPGLPGCCQVTVGVESRQNTRDFGLCPT